MAIEQRMYLVPPTIVTDPSTGEDIRTPLYTTDAAVEGAFSAIIPADPTAAKPLGVFRS